MKKRMITAMLVVAILISLAGCGSTQNGGSSDAAETTETAAVTEETRQTEESTDEQTVPVTESKAAEETKETTAAEPSKQESADTAKEETKQTKSTSAETKSAAEESTPAVTETTSAPTPTTTQTPAKETETAEEKETAATPENEVVQTVTKPTASEIEPLVAKYINEYRTAQGVSSAAVLTGLTAVAEYRAVQLITDFSHYSDPDACTVLKYGEFVDMTELGLDESASYYHGYDAEACAKGNWTGSAEDIARKIADGFKNSSNHWKYLGSSQYTYMAVGLTYDTHTAKWYCCVCVSSQNYGG